MSDALIEVEGPDGSIIEFPAGTSHDVINGALRKRFAPPAVDVGDPGGSGFVSSAMTPNDRNAGAQQQQPPAAASIGPGFADQLLRVPRAIDKGVRMAANGMTFGLADKFAGGMDYVTGQAPSYDAGVRAQRAQTQVVRDEAPIAAGLAEASGGLAGGMGLIRNGVTLAGRVGPSLLPRVAGYGAEGAAYGAAHGAGSTYGDSADDYIQNAGAGAATGGFIGALLPVAGNLASGIYRGVHAMGGQPVEGAGRAASTLMRAAAQADEPGLRALPQSVEAMLPDAGPSMLGLAQGAATGTGPGRSMLVNALRDRDAGTGARLAKGLDDNLGPAPIPSQVAADIKAGQRALSPEYEAAFSNARAVDTGPLAARLDARIVDTVGDAQSALKRVRGMLDIPDSAATAREAASGWDAYLRKPSLDANPRRLFAVREAIDGEIGPAKISGNSKVVGALTEARKWIDDELARVVPGIKEVDAKFAELARQKGGLERGQKVFDTGRETVIRPAELGREMIEGGLPQGRMVGPSAVPFRTRQGARAELDRVVGTQVNDLNALERTLSTPRDWNNQKASTVFGEDKAKALGRLLMDERRMRETYQRVDQGSQTAQRTTASGSLEPGNVPLDVSVPGLTARAAQALGRHLLGLAGQNTKDQVGRVMSTTGEDARRIGRMLLEAANDTVATAKGIKSVVANPALLGASGSANGRR